MPTYRLSGIRLESSLRFPELVEDAELLANETEAPVELTLGPLVLPAGIRNLGDGGRSEYQKGGEETWLVWPDRALARVMANEIQVEPAPGQPEAAIRPLVLGPIFSIILAQRGLVPLHASALATEAGAFCIAADSGGGKSTLASLLQRHGHTFVCDDVAAIDVPDENTQAGEARVHPGFPQMKLAPDILAYEGKEWQDLPRVSPFNNKRAHRLPAAEFQTTHHQLDRIYVIEDGPDELVGPLPPHLALLACLRHVHRSRMIQDIVGVSELMRRLARVAAAVPVYRLRRQLSLDRLGDLAARIESHLAG